MTKMNTFMTFVELDTMVKNMKTDIEAMPYSRVFSLVPFLEGIKKESIHTCDETNRQMEAFWQSLANIHTNDIEELQQNNELQAFIKMMIPSIRVRDKINYITTPYSFEPVTSTSKTIEVLESGDYSVLLGEKSRIEILKSNKLIDAQLLILDRLYGKKFQSHTSIVFALMHKNRNLVQYYHIVVNQDFMDVKYDGTLPDLEDDVLHALYTNIGDMDFWEQYIPKDRVRFEGFSMISWVDVTASENQSKLVADLRSYTFDRKFTEIVASFLDRFRSYFQSEDIDAGFYFGNEAFQNIHPDINLTGFTDTEFAERQKDPDYAGSYAKMTLENPYILIDLTQEKEDSFEKILQDKGYKSLFLYTFYREEKIDIILEIASKNSHQFNNGNIKQMLNLISILRDAYDDNQAIFDGVINSTMQQQFTSIHPSIEWRFREVASRYFIKKQYDDKVQMEEIVFNDLIPLYGQADIVSSSTIRNKSIQTDLVKNLTLIEELMKSWTSSVRLHLLDNKLNEVENLKNEVKAKYNSKTENSIVYMLTQELHPYLASIKDRYELADEPYQNYIHQLDDDLGIIYEKRKQYEESVTRLNVEISSYLDQEDNKMQKVLPHYFEKYKTDGVEYNLYLGKELIQNQDYQDFDLKEFKIWQLKTMCETVRLVDNLQQELSMPMKTAQLVFVYNNPLSIRFRMDEKRFDVDGTYNVRYEILKKRIDKATILGTKDRLTVADKVAIVYVNDSDKNEYLHYLDYLKDKEYITDDIEMLDLNPMQGVDGLKALRVTVKKEKP